MGEVLRATVHGGGVKAGFRTAEAAVPNLRALRPPGGAPRGGEEVGVPELPDVEVMRRHVKRWVLHKRIETVEVVDRRILDHLTPQTFGRRLRGMVPEQVVRHGKHLFVAGDEPPVLLMHFGMSGKLVVAEGAHPEEQYDRVRIRLEDGQVLIYQSRRLLGKVGLVESVGAAIDALALGIDALAAGAEDLRAICGSTKKPVKTMLMDQRRIAGIGNIYSDEILFQARIHPGVACNALSQKQIQRLYEAIGSVLRTAVDSLASSRALPAGFLIPHRSQGGHCPRCRGEVRAIRMAGRRGWFCPFCQKA